MKVVENCVRYSKDDYVKDGGPGEVCLLRSFYHEYLRTWIKTIVNKFAISNHTALISGVHALQSYFKLICEYELHSLPSKKVSGAKDHGKNYIKVRPPLVRHLLRNRLLRIIIHLQIQRIEKYRRELCSKYDREYDFDSYSDRSYFVAS